jgi:hypothetical protein
MGYPSLISGGVTLYPTEVPRIDIIRFMLQAVLNQSRWLFQFHTIINDHYRLNR